MERRTWTPSEKAKSIHLFKAHQKALTRGADLSYPQHLGHPADKPEEEMDAYLLNESKDDLRFHVERDGTKDVDGVYQWWNALHNDINKHGTADPLKKQILIRKQKEIEKRHRDVKYAESDLENLYKKRREAETFLSNFPKRVEAAETILEAVKQDFLEDINHIQIDLDLSTSLW